MLVICLSLGILGMAMSGMDLPGIMLAQFKAPLEQPVLKDPLELLALKVQSGLREIKAIKAIKAQSGLRGTKATRAIKVM